MQPDKHPSIRTSILFWIGALSLIPLTIMATQGYHCARQALIETQHAHMRAMLEARKSRLETMLQVVQSDLHLLSTMSIGSACGNQQQTTVTCMCSLDTLKRAMENKPYYDLLATFSRMWQPVHSTEDSLKKKDIPNTFRKLVANTNSLVFSPMCMDRNGPTVLSGCPLMPSQPTGLAPGFIVGRLNLSSVLIPVLSDRNGLGKRGSTVLITPDGTMLFMDGTHLVSQPVGTTTKSLLKSSEKETGPRLLEENGRTYLALTARIQPVGWTLLVKVDRQEAFHWLRVLGIRAIATGSLTFLLVLLVGIRISRTLSRPLQQLADTANRIGRGDLSRRVPSLPGREAQEVGTAFNQMMNSLEQLQQKLAHQASLAAIGELSSSVVHEMRNPLSSVKINLQALRRFSADSPDYRELSDIALSQVARLERMLTELLRFGRPFELHPEPIAPIALMTDCVTNLAGPAGEHHVQLKLDCPASLPPVRADREQLTRAVGNLLLNAIEASPKNGTVQIMVQLDDMQKHLRIRVSDQGPGIPEGILPELFRPFVSSKPEGTGLGLANVRKIVQAHGGVVTGENGADGAVFTITLPVSGEVHGAHTDHR